MMTIDEQSEDGGGYRPGAVAAGVILLTLGAAMFLDTTQTLHINVGRLVGPFALIAVGASMTLGTGGFVFARGRRRHGGRPPRPRGGPATGVWLIGVGVWMLISQTGLFGLSFHSSWPLLIILGGVMMVMRGLK